MANKENKPQVDKNKKPKKNGQPQDNKQKTAKPKKSSNANDATIQAKNDELLINNTTKDIGKVMNEESKRRKRKKTIWLILLLLLLLFVVIATSILAYFLITSKRKPSNIALEVNISGYLVDENNEDADKLIKSGHYAYKEGEENNQNRQLEYNVKNIQAYNHLRMDYAVTNKSGIAYSYVILVHLEENTNFTLSYYLGTDEEHPNPIPEDNAIRLSSENDFSVSIIIDIEDTSASASLAGSIVFTVII